jgi:hypothetical protein
MLRLLGRLEPGPGLGRVGHDVLVLADCRIGRAVAPLGVSAVEAVGDSGLVVGLGVVPDRGPRLRPVSGGPGGDTHGR